MSETEEVPELSAEAKAFLTGHVTTGEPTAEALERARARLMEAPVEAAAAPMKAPPLYLHQRKRRAIVPPEVMAAAAVVVLLLGAQALYLVLRTPIAPAVEPVAEVEVKPAEPKKEEKKKLEVAQGGDVAELKAVAAVWRSGDYEGARRLASFHCDSPGCAPLAKELSRVLDIIQGSEQLSDEKVEELAAFDESLGGSALRRKLEARKLTPSSPDALVLAERLFEQGREEKKAKNFEAAVMRFEKCLKIAPRYHPCYRMLGSAYAAIAARDGSALDMEKARKAYERFLDVAPPEDEYYPKVEAILDAAKDDGVPARAPKYVVPAVMPIILYVDGTVKLPLRRDIVRITVGDFNVVDAKALGAETVKIEGMHAGKTKVMVWYADGGLTTLEIEVKVSERRVERVAELLDDAKKAMASKDFVLAAAYSRQVLELEPNHGGAMNIGVQLKVEAREAYLRGYQLKEFSPDQAITWFELAVMLTPPEDETHQKAMVRLRELKR